jgi:hypothetical protein
MKVIRISTSLHNKTKEEGSEKERGKITTATNTFGYISF